MTRYLVTINSEVERTRALRAIGAAPFGTRLELKAAKRSLPQNDRMWAMLTDIAMQKEHAGRKWRPDEWKALMMHGCKREMQFMPSLDGETFFPIGFKSSDLTKQEMSDLIEFMFVWGSVNGVVFHDDKTEVAA